MSNTVYTILIQTAADMENWAWRATLDGSQNQATIDLILETAEILRNQADFY